jgi:hypothetical protein
VAAIATLGEPSFLTNEVTVKLIIKNGAKHRIILMYLSPVSIITSSAPSNLSTDPGAKIPNTTNTRLTNNVNTKELVKYLLTSFSPRAFLREYLVAEPIPIIAPKAYINPNTGSTRLSAVIPLLPAAMEMKKVSAIT